MSKKALCVMAESVLPRMGQLASRPQLRHVFSNFYNIPSALIDREYCETEENLLQLLPYLTLVNDRKVFCYSRGEQGGEGRLHSKLSIGIGGHVDVAPTPETKLYTLLGLEAGREFREEVGYPIPHYPEFTHVIIDRTNPVGRVHLGLHAIISTHHRDFTPESGMVEKGQWIDAQILMEVHSRLEPWSQAVADRLIAEKFV